jgi:hypothetical protein
MIFELVIGIGNSKEMSVLVHISEVGAEAVCYVSSTGGCICDQCILAVSSWESHDRLWHELILQSVESVHGLFW